MANQQVTRQPAPRLMAGEHPTGYVVSPTGYARTWHFDNDCPHLSGRVRISYQGREPGMRELVRDQRGEGRSPCRRCALPAVLDNLSAAATTPGYHYLICDDWHDSAGCSTCTSLSRYAASRPAVLTATRDHRVTILLGGTMNGWGGYNHAGDLNVTSTEHRGPAVVTAAMWAVAATLLGPATMLDAALAAADALHANPAGRP